jgi:hypothetical protein
MKKLLCLSLFLFAFAPADKTLKVEAPLSVWNKHVNKLEVIRKIADESNLSNQEVKFITRTIDSLEMLVLPQLQKQLVDTLKPKK